MTRKFAGVYLDFVVPKFYARRWDLLFAINRAEQLNDAGMLMRVHAAAIAACLPGVAKQLPPYTGVFEWGEAAVQWFVDRGAQMTEFAEVAEGAFEVVLKDLPGMGDITQKALEGNPEPAGS